MKKTKYIFNGGRLSRKDNTLKFLPVDEAGVAGKATYVPIEGLGALYCFGSLDVNSALLNYLGRKEVSLHFFDYHDHYTGSFVPKRKLLAGRVLVAQVAAYRSKRKRLYVAQQILDGGLFNMSQTLKYYARRKEVDVSAAIGELAHYREALHGASDVQALMGLEGNARMQYYGAWDAVVSGSGFVMEGRSKMPPLNPLNALVSFGNMMCYTRCLDAIQQTQLEATVSFLHEPGVRRYSLALDMAEVFKPILVDRVIFKLVNKRMVRPDRHFESAVNGCLLNDAGRKVFIQAFEERLMETIQHAQLKRKVSYQQLMRLDAYRLVQYVLGLREDYTVYRSYL